MKKSIKLNSREWCDIVFSGKNKSYGAYEMRMSSSKHHMMAFLFMLMLPVAIIASSVILGKAQASNNEYADGIGVDIVMSDLKVDEPMEEIIEMVVPEPPKPVYQNSVIFVPPIIGEDSEVADDLDVKTMEEVFEDTRTVGYVDVSDGVDDLEAELARVVEDMNKVTEVQTGPLITAEVMPQFPGGEAELLGYVGQNLKYPVIDQENGTQGRVIVRFVVTKTGEIDKVEVVKSLSPTTDREAIRVIKTMPKWIPGRQNGTPVAVYFTLPVLYRLK